MAAKAGSRRDLRTSNGISSPIASGQTSAPSLRSASTIEVHTHGEHLNWVRQHHQNLGNIRQSSTDPAKRADTSIVVDGENLKPAHLVAVALYSTSIKISADPVIREKIDDNVTFLKQHFSRDDTIHSINRGYGGSAILPTQDTQLRLAGRHNDIQLKSHALPRHVVRGSMLARCNCLMRAHSAVRLSTIEALATLLNRDCIPIVPLRGSISAEGDLTPLSYMAGFLEGNPDVYVDCAQDDGTRVILTADVALRLAGVRPVVMDPQEGLGLIQGTAVVCAAGLLALHETQHLALAVQTLTAMATEALGGVADNVQNFVSGRPLITGQSEVVANVARQLRRSRLVVGKDAVTSRLYQDQCSLRTAPQSIGPHLEEFSLVAKELEEGLNSTTCNPFVDAERRRTRHGGSFQASAVTSAMEKTRTSLHMFGKLVYAQFSELIKSIPNAESFDEQGVSFAFEGLDVNMAAYMSELGFLANSLSSLPPSAEMYDQAVSSLALICMRYTMDAVELVSLMIATFLYAVCQTLDLHVMFLEAMKEIEYNAELTFVQHFSSLMSVEIAAATWDEMREALRSALISDKSKDSPQRARAAAEATIVPLARALTQRHSDHGLQPELRSIQTWTEECAKIIRETFHNARYHFAEPGAEPNTSQYMGDGTAVMYRFVREHLGVPFHKGPIENSTQWEQDGKSVAKVYRRSIGTHITVIYESLRRGEMHDALIESML